MSAWTVEVTPRLEPLPRAPQHYAAAYPAHDEPGVWLIVIYLSGDPDVRIDETVASSLAEGQEWAENWTLRLPA